jgi:glucokinase
MNTNYYIGIDLGGSHAAIGLVDDSGNIIAESTLKTQEYKEAADFVEATANAIETLLLSNNIGKNLKGIGIGAPNGNFFNGSIENAPNLPWKGFVPLADMLEKRLNLCPVKLTNDANAAAIGELKFGIAKTEGIRDFIMITLGTGLGSGVVVDGKLVYGHDGFAGELGHSLVSMNGGRLCKCGRKGCLERYASATGLAISAEEALEKSENSMLLAKKGNLSAFDVAEAALAGDKLALKVFDDTAKVLAFVLANATTVTSPAAFIFFGGLANAGELLLSPLRSYFDQYISTVYSGKVRMILSSIPKNHAAVLGAAALVIEH